MYVLTDARHTGIHTVESYCSDSDEVEGVYEPGREHLGKVEVCVCRAKIMYARGEKLLTLIVFACLFIIKI